MYALIHTLAHYCSLGGITFRLTKNCNSTSKINDEKTAFAHYVEHGMKEKREIYPVEGKNEDISKDMKFKDSNVLIPLNVCNVHQLV